MSLSRTMKVVDALEPGGPEALVVVERPMPDVGPRDVLIEVAAAGVNRPDILQRRGRYPPPPGAPAHPGLEVAGVVVAVGAEVDTLRSGDRVCALLAGGGYAEYCAVPVEQVLPVPAGLSLVEAASLPEAYFTVWSNLYGAGRLAAGEWLLVHGGASGIGTAAIQLARARGSVVIATAGSAENGRFCRALGAAHAIDYRTEDFVAAVARLTDGRGVDVILDMVGGAYLPRNLEALAMDGRLVTIGIQGGAAGTLDLWRVMRRRLTLTGSLLRPRSVEFKGAVRAQLEQHVWPLFENGTLRTVVDKVFPLAQAAAAHAYMESGAHPGKIVLVVRDEKG